MLLCCFHAPRGHRQQARMLRTPAFTVARVIQFYEAVDIRFFISPTHCRGDLHRKMQKMMFYLSNCDPFRSLLLPRVTQCPPGSPPTAVPYSPGVQVLITQAITSCSRLGYQSALSPHEQFFEPFPAALGFISIYG